MREELLKIPTQYGSRVDIYSGVARLSGSIWARLCEPEDERPRAAVLIVHPTSNFLGHYALEPLANMGVAAVGLTTRYLGNDSALLMENCVLDIAAAVTHLRERGYERVVLVGNSGGGGLAALYQEQAEHKTITSTPTGDPPDLTAFHLPPVDGLVMLMAHPGRASVYTEWLDPAISDESPDERDPDLDMYNKENGPPYSADFLARYRQAQLARSDRIRTFAWSMVSGELEEHGGDAPFVVHGTGADPRFLDLSIDPSDRDQGTLWGDAWRTNHAVATLGRFTSARSWLSQWSVRDTRCHGPANLQNVSLPVLVVYGSADTAAFPSHAKALYDGVLHDRKRLVELKGATHYFVNQPDLVREYCEELLAWIREEIS